jgi:hypothetical protein
MVGGLRAYFASRGGATVELGKIGDSQYSYPVLLPGGQPGTLLIHKAQGHLPITELQAFLDEWLKTRPGARIDYVHGEGELMRLARHEGCFCFLLPPLEKDALFPAVARGEVLPRKAFSMGRPQDKRYYMEARRIVNPIA